MKAMLLEHPAPIGSAPLLHREVDQPAPGDNQILIRVSVCGLCRTDLHTIEGELPAEKMPIIPGHQIVGYVERCGAHARRFNIGDRVGVAWLHRTCGECLHCSAGQENLCHAAQFTGHHVNGGYAEYAVIDEDFAYAIPQAFSDEEAAPLLCAGIIGYRALRLSEIKAGRRLGLYGFGASAHIAIQVAIHWGCEVYVFTRSAEHRELAGQLGAAWVGGAEDDPPEKVHAAIIFAPAGRLVIDALRVLDRGGTLALAGIYMTPIPEMDYERDLYYERTIRSVTASTRQDGEELLATAAEIPIRTTTQAFNLEDANRGLELLKAGRINGAAVLKVGDSKS